MNQEAKSEFETAYDLDMRLKKQRMKLFLHNMKLCLLDGISDIERFEKEIKED